jgi:hypothetical protein
MQQPRPSSVKGRSTDTLFVFILFIGIAIGAVIMSMVGFGLWALDYVCIYDVDCPAAQHVQVFTPTPIPDLENSGLNLPEATETPLSSPTPDLGATATAACGSFESQFPGTPCPSP